MGTKVSPYFPPLGELSREGYVVYRHLPIENVPDQFRILLLDFVATTPRAFRALWGLFADARSQRGGHPTHRSPRQGKCLVASCVQ